MGENMYNRAVTALQGAKDIEHIMIYLSSSSYKVSTSEGISLSMKLLERSVQVVDVLDQLVKDLEIYREKKES